MAGSHRLEAFLRVTERQGRLKGDLNWLQRLGLNWIMNRELEDKVKLEKVRTENMALASNPQTSPKFLEHLMRQREQENQLEAELEEDGVAVDWQTPTSVEEVEDVLRNLGLANPVS